MAKITLSPIQPLEIEFADGTVKTALFNNEAFIIFNENFGAIDDVLENEAEITPYTAMAKILYCGIKTTDPTITYEEALQIMYMGGTELLFEIAKCITENFEIRSNEETKKKYQELLKKKLTKQEYQSLKELGIQV